MPDTAATAVGQEAAEETAAKMAEARKEVMVGQAAATARAAKELVVAAAMAVEV